MWRRNCLREGYKYVMQRHLAKHLQKDLPSHLPNATARLKVSSSSTTGIPLMSKLDEIAFLLRNEMPHYRIPIRDVTSTAWHNAMLHDSKTASLKPINSSYLKSSMFFSHWNALWLSELLVKGTSSFDSWVGGSASLKKKLKRKRR